MKAILIGRHSGEIPDIEVVEQKNVQFATTSNDVKEQILDLCEDALRVEADAVIFQMCPAQVAVALAHMLDYGSTFYDILIGFVISIPGERGRAKSGTFHFYPDSNDDEQGYDVAKFVNPNCGATVLGDGSITVTVDAPMQFKFSHIEWLNK